MKLKISKAKMSFCKIYYNNEYFSMFIKELKQMFWKHKKYMLKVRLKTSRYLSGIRKMFTQKLERTYKIV